MATADRPSLLLYLPCTTVMPLIMTATVKTMDSQRWDCRIHLFQFKLNLLCVTRDFSSDSDSSGFHTAKGLGCRSVAS
jgi:hypothetical protein